MIHMIAGFSWVMKFFKYSPARYRGTLIVYKVCPQPVFSEKHPGIGLSDQTFLNRRRVVCFEKLRGREAL
jgi:hypothetical protein